MQTYLTEAADTTKVGRQVAEIPSRKQQVQFLSVVRAAREGEETRMGVWLSVYAHEKVLHVIDINGTMPVSSTEWMYTWRIEKGVMIRVWTVVRRCRA